MTCPVLGTPCALVGDATQGSPTMKTKTKVKAGDYYLKFGIAPMIRKLCK
jgi:hypothetical protein